MPESLFQDWIISSYRPKYPYRPVQRIRPARNIHLQKNAYRIYALAIKTGGLVKAEKCSKCESTKKILGHHEDYAHPLVVLWLCGKCHRREHSMKAEDQKIS